MKLKYEKPAIRIEDFSLCQNIARDCGNGPNGTELGVHTHSNSNMCEWDLGPSTGLDMKLWNSSINAECNQHMEADSTFMGICYNSVEGSISAFGS